MLFMVVEHFRDQDAKAVHCRPREVDSWIETNSDRCFPRVDCATGA